MQIKTEEISLAILKQKKIRLFVKRIDKVHPFISGNKWYKLKYNLIAAKEKGFKTILTFGGAYSNHIAATAFAAQEKGFKSIGIIRGEEHLPLNSTLSFVVESGMELHYVSRTDYREKTTPDFLEKLKAQFGSFYFIPEGGTNELAIQGTAEILEANDSQDYICCAVGTGGTISGIVNSSVAKQKVLGFSAIKGSEQLEKDISIWTNKENWELITDYHFEGYAKISEELTDFIMDFYDKNKELIQEKNYTNKLLGWGFISLSLLKILIL